MEQQFQSTGFDPVKGAEIMSLAGVSGTLLSIPQYQAQIKNIVSYFANHPNPRSEILSVLNGKQGNKLEVLWGYVELQKEKQAALAKLDPNDFEKDVAQDIVSGHIPRDKRLLIQKQLAEGKIDSDKLALYITSLSRLDYLDNQLNQY